jgi:hypothetical protein
LAIFRLDFVAEQSVCGGERSHDMDAQVLEATLKAHISEMRSRLEEAAGIAKAASACAEAGNISKAVEIALDVEQLIYEVNTFLNAASLMHRIGRS